MLGFSPVNAKPDGKLHALKVAVNCKEKYTVAGAAALILRLPQNPTTEDAGEYHELREKLYLPASKSATFPSKFGFKR